MYQLDERGLEWSRKAQAIARDIAAPAAGDVDRNARFPAEAVSALGKQGFFGLALPIDTGGGGQPPRVFAAVVEELAQSCSSAAMIYVMHVSGAQVLSAATAWPDRERVLGDIVAGRHLTTLAFSERKSRSQFWAPVSILEPETNGRGYRTDAWKSWVTSAGHADSYVSSAQKPGAASPLESTLYFVRRDAKGLRVDGGFDGLGLRGNDSAPVQMENVHVDDHDLLTAHGDGLAAMLQIVLPWFVVGTAAMANGLCRRAVTLTIEHLTRAGFEHDGSKLRNLPNLRARLAEMNACTEQSRALLAHTVAAMERPDEMTPLYVLQSRLAAIEAALHVTDLAMQACGGAAFSRQLGIERLFRDARAGWVMAPTADHLREFIGPH